MGTRKKLFLASLVSLTMVLAFMIGLVPSSDHGTEAAPGSDTVDMQSLIDLMLNDSAKQVGVVTLDSDWAGFKVETPAGNTEQQDIVVPLTATAGTGDTVTFVANAGDDVAFDGASSTWTGDTYTDPLDAPWEGSLNVGALFANAAETLGATVPIYIYALVNAVEETKQISLVYAQANDPADAVKLTVEETQADVDANGNAFPDDLLAQVGPGEIWLANRGIDKQTGAMRYVAIANLAGAPGSLTFGPTANVSVEAPTFDSLLQGQPDGWGIEEGESAYAIIEVTGSLASLLDVADGGATEVADWADSVEDLQPGMLAGTSSYVNVSLIYTLEGQSQYDEIVDLTGTALSVNITMSGLSLDAFDVPKMFSYPTEVTNNGNEFVLTNEAGLQTWTPVAGADISVADNVAMASVQELSVFAVLNAGLSISSTDQVDIPQGYTADITLHGIVPTATELSAAAASALFTVTVDGQPATFRDGALKQAETGAISAWTGTGLQTINITTPVLTTTGDVDVQITEIANPSNTATATGLLNVVATHEVTVEVEGQGNYAPMADAADITLTPANSPTLPQGIYLQGTAVTGSIQLDPSEVLVGWEVNGAAVGTSLAFSVNADTEVVAIVGPASTEGFHLEVAVSPFGAGAVQIAPMPDNDGMYAAGTEVTLTAEVVASGFTFADWTGNVTNPAAATTTIIMNQDQVVTANFEGGNTFDLTIAVNNATMGTTVPAPGTYVCAAGSHRGIEAVAEQGYQFVGWTGDVLDAEAAETEVTMDANKTVTANFMVPPTTDGIQLTPEEIAAGITRPEVWLFGGVSRVITGNGLTNATPIFIGDTATGNVVQIQGYNAAADGTSVMILMPTVPDGLLAAGAMNVEVDLALGGTIGAYDMVYENAILYKRHASMPIAGSTATLNTTAFMLESSEGADIDVSIGGGDFATLELPALEDAAHNRTLYGIARNAQILSLDAKNNTAPIESLQMGTGALANVADAGDYLADSIEFSFYLYEEPQEVKWNTDTVGPQQPNEPFLISAVGASGGSLFDVPAPLNPDGTANPASSPALLTIDAKNAFTYADVRNGLAMWGVESAYDYATNLLTVPDPAADAYQSELLANNVNPALTANSVDAANPDLVVKARLYSLNGFSLRKNWSMPADIAELVMLQTANGSGTASGPMEGGTELTIVSPMGALGFVNRVALTSSAKAINASVTIPPTGASETQITFKTPEVEEPGIVDLTIYLRSDPTNPAVVLNRVFEYKQESCPLDSLALILLGLLVALIGLIAGGNSGGGGGGPCFIATAAYGTPMAADIDTLRSVRDTFMLDSTIGTAFVDAYYQASPAIADVVAQSPALAALVRILLVPVVFLGKVALAMPLLTALVGLSLGFAFFMRRRSAHKA